MIPKFPFCYVISSGSLTASTGSANITQIFNSVKNFKLRFIRMTGNTGVKVQISEVSGNNFSNNPFFTALVGSNQNNGMPVVDNIIIPAGTQLVFAFTNSDSSAHTEEIQLWGEEID